MRELHSVSNKLMIPPTIVDGPVASDRRPPPSPGLRPRLAARNSSNTSVDSASSAFSFQSCFSTSSTSTSSITRRNSSVPPSPALRPSSYSSHSGTTESRSVAKKRSRASVRDSFSSSVDSVRRMMRGLRTERALSSAPSSAHSSGSSRPREELAAWSNIKLWTREVGRIVKAIDRLSMRYTAAPSISGHPFDSPGGMLAFRDALDLKGFEAEVKRYRKWVHSWERQNGRSKRVFAHNDTCVVVSLCWLTVRRQYGNLLLRTRDGIDDPAAVMEAESIRLPHELLIVVDFEYAALNSRAFDIANHFVEYRADYHAERSWSLEVHLPAPTQLERYRFFRAYLGVDGGINGDETDDKPVDDAQEDPRVQRLEAEVRAWTAASHAMWAMWGASSLLGAR